MFTLTYALVALTAVLLVGAAAAAFRSRNAALVTVAMALIAGVAAAVTSAIALGEDVGPKAHKAVSRAAEMDVEVDAVAQWMLTDNVITPSEYGQIAEVYRERTGRELGELAK